MKTYDVTLTRTCLEYVVVRVAAKDKAGAEVAALRMDAEDEDGGLDWEFSSVGPAEVEEVS